MTDSIKIKTLLDGQSVEVSIRQEFKNIATQQLEPNQHALRVNILSAAKDVQAQFAVFMREQGLPSWREGCTAVIFTGRCKTYDFKPVDQDTADKLASFCLENTYTTHFELAHVDASGRYTGGRNMLVIEGERPLEPS